jgi:hypothetical protein
VFDDHVAVPAGHLGEFQRRLLRHCIQTKTWKAVASVLQCQMSHTPTRLLLEECGAPAPPARQCRKQEKGASQKAQRPMELLSRYPLSDTTLWRYSLPFPFTHDIMQKCAFVLQDALYDNRMTRLALNECEWQKSPAASIQLAVTAVEEALSMLWWYA